MDLGLHYADFSLSGDDATSRIAGTLAETARVADQGGIAQMTLMDHWFQMENLGGPAEPMLEGYTGLGYLAAVTERLTLGLLVTGVTYRHPGLLAKTVTTLDVLSGGRGQLGIGAAWYDREHAGLGVPFPPLKERYERLAETLRICAQMWGADDGPFEGEHFQLAETVCVPAPLTRTGHLGGPPVMIGGSGERKTLRLVAEYADACNLFGSTTEEISHKLDVLVNHCRDLGRDPAGVRRTVVVGEDPLGDTDAWLRQMEEYAALGVSMVVAGPPGADPVGWTTEVVESVLPRLREIEPAAF